MTRTYRTGKRARLSRRLASVPLAAIALGAAACDAYDTVPPADSAAGDSTALAADTVPRMREIVAVEMAALADSAAALRLRDSLVAAGWPAAMVRRLPPSDSLPAWRVRVASPGDAELAQTAGMRFAAAGRSVRLTRDSAARRGPDVILRPVNRGRRGAISRLRWALAPGRRAILAVEDPSAVENEPHPDGFLLAAERGRVVVQRDSVWDVTPDPKWERVAYGRAYLISVEGRDSVAVRQWASVASRTNLDIGAVRRSAFEASSMNQVYGFAQPMIEPLHPDSADMSPLIRQVTTPVPMPGGWRLRWSTDGRTLAVGVPPERNARDDSPASSWLALDPNSHLVRGALPSHVSLAGVEWVDGPVFDVSVELPTTASPIAVEGGTVETRGGWVVLDAPLSGGRRAVVGPGVALAATRTGQFILALAPDPEPAENAPRMRPVVYQVVGR